MGRSFGSRALLAIGGALVILLAGLAAVQYRWSTRVAAADVQRETEHLESAASLFAGEFNGMVGQATRFLQNDAWAALQSRERLAGVPKLIGELYYLESLRRVRRKWSNSRPEGSSNLRRRRHGWRIPHCATLAIEEPTALVAPVYDIAAAESRSASGTRILKTFRWRPDRCFVAQIDEKYLRGTLFPQLIRQSFGEEPASEYNFAVVPAKPADRAFYGGPPSAPMSGSPSFRLLPSIWDSR